MKLKDALNEMKLGSEAKKLIRTSVNNSVEVSKLLTLYIDAVLSLVNKFDFSQNDLFARDARKATVEEIIKLIDKEISSRKMMLKK